MDLTEIESRITDLLVGMGKIEESIKSSKELSLTSKDSLSEKITSLENEVWDIRKKIEKISSHDKDIGVLNEKLNTMNAVIDGINKELSAKMATKDDLITNIYSDWRIKLALFSLFISITMSVVSVYTIFFNKVPNEKVPMSKGKK